MVPRFYQQFLDNMVQVLKNDTRIVGVTVGGSYITEEGDQYSDLDIIIAVNPQNIEEVMDERYKIAERFGNLLSGFTGEHVGEPRLLICLYGPPLLHVDLKFISLEDIVNRVEDPIILWERDNILSSVSKLSSSKFPTPDLQWIEDRFWVWVHYATTKIGRGEIFETIEFISFLRQTVIGPLILMKNGKFPRGVRRIELDAPSDLPLLLETIPTHTVESCGKAIENIIDLYLNLRDHFKTDKLNIHLQAEKYSKVYLNKILQAIENIKPKEILLQWVDAFNNGDVETISELYDDNAINHQVANEPVVGKEAIKEMFRQEFSEAKMVCIVENIFEDGEWTILEWRDSLGLRGCGFFQIVNNKIIFQRGYWDKLSFLKQHNLPIK